jgi:hypothetical protein
VEVVELGGAGAQAALADPLARAGLVTMEPKEAAMVPDSSAVTLYAM